MILSAVLALILFICVAMLLKEGLWSNCLNVINAIFAGLVASSLWEPVADWLEGIVPGGTYLWDFVALWLVFFLCFLILRVATDLISRVKVRFKRPVDQVGGILCAVWVGWVMLSFTAMTLHTAPLARHFLFGTFYQQENDKIFFGMFAPDRQWLSFVRQLSRGSLAGMNEFDPQEKFIQEYGERREQYEKVTGIFADDSVQ